MFTQTRYLRMKMAIIVCWDQHFLLEQYLIVISFKNTVVTVTL